MTSSLSNAARLVRTLFVLARYDVLAPKELTAEVPKGLKSLSAFLRLLSWRAGRGAALEARLAEALPKLGPSYIKIGQLLAARPDLVGPELAGALSVLQDKLPPFEMAEAEAALEAAFGKPMSALFERLDAPFAAASVAQVHRGWLKDTEDAEEAGARPVAVKILRPGIRRIFQRDIDTFFWGATWLERLVPSARRLEPLKLVGVLAQSMRMELDLRLEGAAASELLENTRGDGDLIVPQVIWPRTAERVLTTEWIEGIPLTDNPALDAAGIDRRELSLIVIRSFLTQALRDGYFHADMHQGNLFAVPPSADGAPLKLAVVDFGIMGRLSRESRVYLGDILMGFILQDYLRVARAHFDAGYVSADFPVEDFAQALRAIGEPVFGQLARDISMAKLLMQLFQTTETFNMHLQPQLVLLQKTMMVVEGVARALDRDHDMWDAARPVVERFIEEMMGPEAMVENVARGAQTLGRIVARAPESLERLERAGELLAQMTEEGGLRLHPDTAREMAEMQRPSNSPGRWALVVALAALAAVVWQVVF
ncbi:MAG: 2-polyprenylphenol 6-hydroxylase [Alphaproteobacteria bacterium]|nr:MAG: 2-polyprenylphenol 6-hydroxylase [Alphaproteobacteria bacterium]